MVRKPFIFLLGFTVVAVGIILIPLPGPGWAVVFVGFAILATEFHFAEKVRDHVVGFLKKIIKEAEHYWHALSRREQILLIILAIFVCIVAIFAIWCIMIQ